MATHLQHHRPLDTALDGRHPLDLQALAHAALEGVATRHVAGGCCDRHAPGLEGLHKAPALRIGLGPRSRQQHQMPGPATDHPARDRPAQPPESAREDVRGIRIEPRRLLPRRLAPGQNRHDLVAARLEHQLADVLGRLHVAERPLHVRHGEDGDGHLAPDAPEAGPEHQCHGALEHAVRPPADGRVRLPDEVGQVEGLEPGMPREVGHAQPGVGGDVGGAQLDEPAQRGHAVPRRLPRLARERVEHDVDAAPARLAEELGLEAEVAAGEDVVAREAIGRFLSHTRLTCEDENRHGGPLAY